MVNWNLGISFSRKMPKKNLIITSGSSQLITQLATLNELKVTPNNVYILYNGLKRESLELYFIETSRFFGFTYVGQINFKQNPIKLSFVKSVDLLFKRLFNFEHKLIIVNNQILDSFIECDLLIIPIRVKVFSDIVLLHYLKPKQIKYTADGIIDILPNRNFKSFGYYYLRNNLKSFPINYEIYSPLVLKEDILKIGVFHKIETQKVMTILKGISMVQDFKRNYLEENVGCIVISQHYHLHENVSFINDLEYYKNMILKSFNLIADNQCVLFKPHPRDTMEKIEAIKSLNYDRLIVVDKKYQAVPLEIFEEDFKRMKTYFIGGNSSAVLYYDYKRVISVYSDRLLSPELNSRIASFAKKYNFNLMEI